MISRIIFGLLGGIALILGIIGIFLPILPTTPFIILAAACWTRSFPKFRSLLYRNRVLCIILQNWEARRAIPRRAKYLAFCMMALSCLCLLYRFPTQWWWSASAALFCFVVAVWIWRRPDA